MVTIRMHYFLHFSVERFNHRLIAERRVANVVKSGCLLDACRPLTALSIVLR